jgi:DNA polymerase III subunit beta
MPEAEYPPLPALPAVSGTVPGDSFAQAVSQVIIAASKDDTLPILTGVRMEIEDDLITLLATDRYRLAMREVPWKPVTPGISTSALVKAKTLNEVAKTLGNSGDIQLALSDDDSRLIGFESGGRTTTSLLVDGDYPKIRSLFPDSTPIHATVQTQELVEAVRRVSLVAERNTPVRLAFTQGLLNLDAGTGEDAQASEELEAQLSGDDITVAFNPHYLVEGLSVIETKFVRFSFTTAPKPAMITAQADADGEDQDDYRYLVMPVRLPN